MKYDILITNIYEKQRILKQYTQEKKIHSMKIFTINEIEELYFGKLDDLSLYEIVKTFHFHPKVAQLCLTYLPFIENDVYTDKLKLIKDVKDHMIKKGYLHKDKFFENFFQNKKILFYHMTLTQKQEQIKSILEENNEVFEEEEKRLKHPLQVHAFQKIEDEVVFVASTITKLLNEGKDINKIKIYLSANDYEAVIFRIFSLFHIPFTEEKQNLSNFPIILEFLKYLEENTIDESLQKIEEKITSKEKKIYDTLLSITNPYLGIEDEYAKEVILYKIKNKKISLHTYENVVSFVSLDEVMEDDTLFILGVNQDYFPKIYQDDDFLSDQEKKYLKIETSIEKNKQEKQNALTKIYSIKNVYLSYKLESNVSYVKSSIIEEENMEEVYPKYEYINTFYNQYLRCKSLDHYLKYHEKNHDFEKLIPLKNEQYLTYDSKYQKIDINDYHNYLKNYIRLSYSTLTTFFKCPFRFYVSKILKIYDMKKSTSLDVGNIVHNVLCTVLKEKRRDFENVIDTEMDKIIVEKSKKIDFYKEKWKKEIITLINMILKDQENTEFQNTYLEETFEVSMDKSIKMILEGKIDKVMTYQKNDQLYVMIVDYKTGTIDTDFNPVYYGLNMQLLIYYYLIKETQKNIKPAGFYYQNIMKNLMNKEENKTYQELLEEAYRLEGYTVEDLILLSSLVKDIDHSFIKGLKLKNDGSFYSTSKVLDERKMEKLIMMVENHIKDAMERIEKGSFEIHPIQIGNEKIEDSTGCKFCAYRDICYRKNTDFNRVKKQEKLSFLEEGEA